jgi:hypothetical protein
MNEEVDEAAEKAWVAYRNEYPGPLSGYDVRLAFLDGFTTGGEWARKETLREAAALVKAEIERLELVKGTYAKAQRHSLGLIWAHLRSAALAEAAS